MLHGSAILVGGTGLVYAWMRYFAQPTDEFAIVNHPWQPYVQHAHIVLAPLLVFGCGVLWPDHVWARIRANFRPRRITGLALAILLLPMILSGYLLQVSSGEISRQVWIVVHVASSIAWILTYAWHQLRPRPPQPRLPPMTSGERRP
jgi:hypothetical protein